MKKTSKFEPLYHYLVALPHNKEKIKLTFSDIEKIIGKPLPESAYKFPAWWVNDSRPGRQSMAWLTAGFKTRRVDLGQQIAPFVRVERNVARRKVTESLETIAERVRLSFTEKDQAREQALTQSRETIRYSTNSIRALHRQKYDEARQLLQQARSLLDKTAELLKEHGELLHSGYVQDAQKEFAEGCLTLALVLGEDLPTPESLGVGCAPYLNGLGEAVGELRRYLLDGIRREDLSRSEELLSAMDDIYGILVTMDFPDALTGGLRRTTDVVRGILEKTRGDLTLAFEQRGLGKKLEILEQKLRGGDQK